MSAGCSWFRPAGRESRRARSNPPTVIEAFLSRLALSAAGTGLVMAILWRIQRRTRNAAIVDVGWTLSLPLLALLDAALAPGWAVRSWILAAMVWLWGGRLALHLAGRLRSGPEEARYARLRQEWGPQADRRFFIFYQQQALASALFSIPFILVSLDHRSGLGLAEWLGGLLWFTGFLGEAVADEQLRAFKASTHQQGRVCRSGLWRYSRHPNYFFEILTWVGYATFASGSPGFPWGWLSPAMIAWTLVFVTGIPPAEAQALSSKGDEYRRYQQTTSALVPWFPRPDPGDGAVKAR